MVSFAQKIWEVRYMCQLFFPWFPHAEIFGGMTLDNFAFQCHREKIHDVHGLNVFSGGFHPEESRRENHVSSSGCTYVFWGNIFEVKKRTAI